MEMNYLAVLGATIAVYVLGWLWYSVLFGKPWRKLMGFSDEIMRSMKMTAGGAMIGGFVTTLILVYALAALMQAMIIASMGQAVLFGFHVGIGFIAMVLANQIWYENKSFKLYLINAAYYVVGIPIAAAILYYF